MKLKKIFSYSLALAFLGLSASCSNDEPGRDNGSGSNADSYIRVQIANTLSVTRADGYDAGTEGERKISDIAFYFFYEDGTPFKMENNNINGTLSPSNMVSPKLDLPTSVNGKIEATLVLGKAINEGWKGTVPSKMVAVANLGKASEIYNQLTNISLSEFHRLTRAAKTSIPKSGEFVMSSSTYQDKDGNTIYWSDIKFENIGTTPEAAIACPVNVHIERLAAKFTVTLDPKADKVKDDLFIVATRPLLDADGNQTSKTFYAKISGWDLNGTPTSAFISKNIDAADVPFDNWNISAAFRSCWAQVPAANGLANGLNTKFKWASLKNQIGEFDYCYENTLQPYVEKVQDASSKAVKVLLRAHITDEAGTPLDLISWAGTLYKTDDFKTMVARMVQGDEGKPGLVTFQRDSKDKMHVVSTYYNDEKINTFDNVRHWEQGVCYYIVNVRHTTDEDGKNVFGVVRNHYYKVSVNSIAGLGTPGGTDDHDKPENPDPELESFVAATVDILDWHVVDYSVDVES